MFVVKCSTAVRCTAYSATPVRRRWPKIILEESTGVEGGHIEMRRLAEYFGPALYTCRLLKQQPAHQATRPNRGHIQSRTAAESPRRPAVQHAVREPHYKPVQGNPPQPGTSEWRPCSERLANKRRMSHPLGSEWVGEAAVNN